MNKNNKGFVHLLLIVVIAAATISVVGYSMYKNSRIKNQEQQAVGITPTEEENNTGLNENALTPTISSKATTTQKPTVKPTSKPTNTPAPSSASSSSCSYNLTSATGALKINIQAQSGVLVGDQIVELQAKAGCKVLVNKSADKDTRIARQGSPSADFSSVPPGSYSARISYKGQWTSFQNVSVNSAQQTVAAFSVQGDTPTTAPVPTSKPKPTCMNPIIYPSSTGTAPFQATLQPQGSAGSAGAIQGYEWDYTGDGTWDTSASPNAQIYTFQNSGTYMVKMRVLATNGEYSDTCQTTVIVN